MKILKTTKLKLSMDEVEEAVTSWLQENSNLPIPAKIQIDWNLTSDESGHAEVNGIWATYSDGWKTHEVI